MARLERRTKPLARWRNCFLTMNTARLIGLVLVWVGFWRVMTLLNVGVIAAASLMPTWAYGVIQVATGLLVLATAARPATSRRRRLGYAAGAMFCAWLGFDLCFAHSWGSGGLYCLFALALLGRANGNEF